MRYPHRARRRYGQHFLHDPRVVERIVDAIDPRPGQPLLEIGPGLGALTAPLLDRAGELVAVEVDRDLCEQLSRTFEDRRELSLINADALRLDLSSLAGRGEPIRIAGNLPYNISTPLLFHLLEQAGHIHDMHFMLQREVAERMAAGPGSKTYGRLSVMVQVTCTVERLFHIGPGAFRPPPKVHSTLVRLVVLPTPRVEPAHRPAFDWVVSHLFSHRRKTLRASLRGRLEAPALRGAGVDPSLRPESLDLAAFARLAVALESVGIPAVGAPGSGSR